MIEIDYSAIIKKAWNISWKNKFLWWFGFFILLGGGVHFNYFFPNSNQKSGSAYNLIANFISNEKSVAIAGIIFLLALLAFFIFISLRAKAAIIKSIGKIMKNENCDFSIGFQEGKKYFWRILLVEFILGFIVFGLAVVIAVPVIFLFFLKAYFLAVFSAILAVVILLPIIILSAFINLYALIYIVSADLLIQEAVENAYRLFRKNIIPSIIMGLFFILFRFSLFAAEIFIGLGVLIVFGPGIVISYLIFSKIGIIIVCVIALVIFSLMTIILNSIYNTFSQTVWIIFFGEIAKQKEEELAEEKESYPVKIPKPEEAGL